MVVREKQYARRSTNRKVRHTVRAEIHAGRFDTLPGAPKTEGWETW
jgi:hypothetical protein